ncbi:MAG: response regulator [Phycisphaera sp.]|nr:response regulator [Phycisphaera sp.]
MIASDAQPRPRILVVDDDPIVADSLADFLHHEGYSVATAGDGNEAMRVIEDAAGSAERSEDNRPFGVVVADVNMPRADGMELLKRIRKKFDSIVVIMVTGFGKIESAVEAVRLGAADYLTKPLVDDELRIAVDKAVRQHILLHENQSLKSQLVERFGMANLVGSDYRMQKVYDLIEAVAESKTTVLITGESGTGKTMVARAVHTRSPHASGPFVTFACGAIPETLLESELFGHVKGAFTGADNDKPGKLQAADGGTLFIDEINSATPALQLKLLRVLQEKQFEPVGSNKTMKVDVRFVLATNQSLEALVSEGRFREDLFYRINVVNIKLPPLRERSGDVPLLAEHFLAKYCAELRKDRALSNEATEALRRHNWPGNVRELENAIERAVVLSRGAVIGVDDLPDTVKQSAGVPSPMGMGGQAPPGGAVIVPALKDGWTPTPLIEALLEPERQVILAALEANNWNRQETAAQLNINRTTLYKKIKQFRLDEPA